jgi:hypothetical protein
MFSSKFFVTFYIPPQSDAGTKIALNELHSAISKQENVHPEATLLVAWDFNAGKLKTVLPNFYQHVNNQRENISGSPKLHTQRCIQSSPSPYMWQI